MRWHTGVKPAAWLSSRRVRLRLSTPTRRWWAMACWQPGPAPLVRNASTVQHGRALRVLIVGLGGVTQTFRHWPERVLALALVRVGTMFCHWYARPPTPCPCSD
ncbi:MAG: hypothetical protein HC893_06875 [Chloroflexaceae bacterium]|nr:hypothetical protein [Chloroflexaceae bacterium]